MTAALATRTCARCGSRIRGLHVFSKFTRATYCADLNGCAVRARRRKKKEAVA